MIFCHIGKEIVSLHLPQWGCYFVGKEYVKFNLEPEAIPVNMFSLCENNFFLDCAKLISTCLHIVKPHLV